MKKFLTSLILFFLPIILIIGITITNIKLTLNKDAIKYFFQNKIQELQTIDMLNGIFGSEYDPKMIKYFDKYELKEAIVLYMIDETYYLIGLDDKPNTRYLENIFQLTLDEYAMNEGITIKSSPLEKYYEHIEEELNFEEIPEYIKYRNVMNFIFGKKLFTLLILNLITIIILVILINASNINEGLSSIKGTLVTTIIIIVVTNFPLIPTYLNLLVNKIFIVIPLIIELILLFVLCNILKRISTIK